MKTPKFTLFFTVLFLLAFLLYDSFFMPASSGAIELVQDLVFVLIGGFSGLTIFQLQDNNKKPNLIDSKKLALEVAQDEKKQLEDKVKTLEAALERLMK